MKLTAIMPIKLQNERLPGKNTKLLGGKPLIHYSLFELLKSEVADEAYVFCSDPSIIPFLLDGVNFLKRDPKLDLPTSNFTQIFDAFMSIKPSDCYLYTHATTPFVTACTIQKCVRAVQSGGCDSAFTAVKIQDFLWKDGEPFNFDAENLPRSQDIQPIYRESSGIYVFKREVFAKHRRRIGQNPYIHEISIREAVDINTQDDFELAEALIDTKI